MRDSGFRYLIRSENGTLAYVGRVGTTLSASVIKFQNRNGALKVARRLELRTKKKHFVYAVRNVAETDPNDPSSGSQMKFVAEREIPPTDEMPTAEEMEAHADMMDRPDDIADKIDYRTGKLYPPSGGRDGKEAPEIGTDGRQVKSGGFWKKSIVGPGISFPMTPPPRACEEDATETYFGDDPDGDYLK